jgi:hypothetical protein
MPPVTPVYMPNRLGYADWNMGKASKTILWVVMLKEGGLLL